MIAWSACAKKKKQPLNLSQTHQMKQTKSPTPFDRTKTGKAGAKKATRKNSNASTRKGERQRSGNNGPQQGSH
jgi:hypothetical protein